MSTRSRSAKWFVAAFLFPALAIYVVFQIIPLFGAGYFSLSDWDGIAGKPIAFVGVKNYVTMFQDKGFLLSLKNMLVLVLGSVAFHTPIALLLAVALQSTKRGLRVMKAIYFIPTVFPMTATGLMWYFIFMPNGSFNELLKMVGLEGAMRAWLVDPASAMPTITAVNIWAGIGYYLVIILAGLTTVPTEVYEAADIDGANPLEKLLFVTVPMIRSTLLMCVMMDIMSTIKLFDLIFSMTEGGPNGLTNLPTTLMYQEAFRYDHYGVGSAIGIVILAISFGMTVLVQVSGKESGDGN